MTATAEASTRLRDRITQRMQTRPSVRTIQCLLITHALRHDRVTANDVREAAEAMHPHDLRPNDFGAATTGLRSAGVLRSCGYGPPSTSDRPQGNHVRVWAIDVDAAEVFLARLAEQQETQ